PWFEAIWDTLNKAVSTKNGSPPYDKLFERMRKMRKAEAYAGDLPVVCRSHSSILKLTPKKLFDLLGEDNTIKMYQATAEKPTANARARENQCRHDSPSNRGMCISRVIMTTLAWLRRLQSYGFLSLE
ncbi:unnamed protein product, partial [Ectocarpus sp. 12 AP-2014]